MLHTRIDNYDNSTQRFLPLPGSAFIKTRWQFLGN